MDRENQSQSEREQQEGGAGNRYQNQKRVAEEEERKNCLSREKVVQMMIEGTLRDFDENLVRGV